MAIKFLSFFQKSRAGRFQRLNINFGPGYILKRLFGMDRIKQLDGLRCTALLLVLIQHLSPRVGFLFASGYYGVELFFVISGFLITGILMNLDEPFFPAYKKFMGRRALRIFPIYYLTLFFLYAVHFPAIRTWFFYFVTYTLNYAIVRLDMPMDAVSHFWSLCVEEQFYICWPFIVLALRNRPRVLIWVLGLLAAASGLQLCFSIVPAIAPYNMTGLFPRGYALVIGALGAVLFKENKSAVTLLTGPWPELLNYGVLLFFLTTDYPVKLVICPLCALVLVLKTVSGGFHFKPLDVFLSNRLVIYTGTISYAMYIFHLPLTYFLNNYIFEPFVWSKLTNHQSAKTMERLHRLRAFTRLPVYGFITFVFAHFSAVYIERPLLSLKNKYFR